MHICSERHSHHAFSCHQQVVSDMAHIVKGSLITSSPMTNSEWVTWHILWKAVFPMTNRMWATLDILWKAVSSHPFLWPTGLSEWHCTSMEGIFSYDQQYVSDIAHFVKGSLTSFLWPTGCEWQTLHILWKAVITSFPFTNFRLWVTLHILCKAVSSHIFLWPTGCEWCCTFCERQSHHIL